MEKRGHRAQACTAALIMVATERYQQVQHRLEILRLKLDAEGLYVGANTVTLAQDLLEEMARSLSDKLVDPAK